MTANIADLSDALAAAAVAGGAGLVRVEARHHRGASGVVYSADGLIVTANHAVQRDEQISVTLADDRALEATLIGRDPGTDLAVLKVDAAGLTPPAWAAADTVRVGQLALALGRPGKTVRAALGVVGTYGEGFRTPFGARIDRYLEIDRDLPRGFSGGLALDAHGRALGVTTSGLLRGANMVVPASTVARVVGELRAHGRVPRGYLGVGVYPVRFGEAQARQHAQGAGLLLVAVEPGSPAEKAGLVLGDVLLAIDGQSVERPGDLSALLGDKVGREVTAKVLRGGAATEVKLAVGQRAA